MERTVKSPALKIIVASLALAAGAAMAQGYGYGPGMGYGPGGRGATLTPEQRDRLASVRDEHRAKNWDAMNELRAEQWKLRDLYAARADAAAIAEQQKKVDGLREQMFARRADMRREMGAALAR